ncbi:MAG: redox-regulated ATPase YchF [Desulfovibrio sp.]|nr:redox-regulated ATPase YchF [Desulfovibrio sp.]
MALSMGIVGLPNVGKSTLFNALTRAGNAQAANYPFCTIEPNKATVPVPDERVDQLSAKVSPKKTIYAAVDFIDIAGLVEGASKGEGLGNQFLGNIRECAAIIQVVRCFEDDNIAHVAGSVDPVRDAEIISAELLLADIQTAEKRLEKTRKLAKASKDHKVACEILENLVAWLNEGREARDFKKPDNEIFLDAWREMELLTAKPVIYLANVDEDSAASGNPLSERLEVYAKEKNAPCVRVCARLEEELRGLEKEERAELLASYGAGNGGLETVIRESYRILGLRSYFTAGPDEVRAWTIRGGWKAPRAAGVIHTDFERGFIRAEVVSFDDFMSRSGEAECRADGVLRSEGKDYEMQDGDVVHFLFNV